VSLIELFPWLFIVWFTLGLVGCYAAVANIGSRASDVSTALLAGIVAGPIGFVIALWLRSAWRKKNK